MKTLILRYGEATGVYLGPESTNVGSILIKVSVGHTWGSKTPSTLEWSKDMERVQSVIQQERVVPVHFCIT